MKRGHVPERTCRGCGQKAPQSGLLRFVVVDGRLVAEGRSGKGIYCCNRSLCRDRLAKSKKVLKAD
jgi:predicted RNA-binding protein YlxR (DUF448 family)